MRCSLDTRPIRTSAAGVLCLFAVSCQSHAPPPVERTSNTALFSVVPACASGTSATLAGGLRIKYLGSGPDDPHRCLVQWSDRAHPLYFGFWSGEPKSPLTDEARTAFRTALTGPVGASAAFSMQGGRLWSGATVTHTSNGTIAVAGQSRTALELAVVLHDAHGRPGVRAETRYMIDRNTGVLLRRQTVTPMASGEVTTTTNWQIGSLQEAG